MSNTSILRKYMNLIENDPFFVLRNKSNDESFKDSRKLDIIHRFILQHRVRGAKILPDFTIDVDNDVNLGGCSLRDLPIQFNRVNGFFNISFNEKLISLKGCPKFVGGYFDCSDTDINSLSGGPEIVEGNYLAQAHLRDLQGFPKKIGGYLDMTSRNLNSFEDLIVLLKSDIGGPIDLNLLSLTKLFQNRTTSRDRLRIVNTLRDWNTRKPIE